MANSELEEIRDILGDFETRISFLENSLPGSAVSYQEEERKDFQETKQEHWNRKQWDIINELRGEVAYLRNKLANLDQKHIRRDRL